MVKKLKKFTFIDNKKCLTETIYKGYKIYKVCYKGLEYYSILKGIKLQGTFWKLKDAKENIDDGLI